MTTKEIFDAAARNNGIRATVDRFSDGFLSDNYLHDNSFNWEYCDAIYEIRQNKHTKTTYVWVADDQNCDPRCDTYLNENCIIFDDVEDFYQFASETTDEPTDE